MSKGTQSILMAAVISASFGTVFGYWAWTKSYYDVELIFMSVVSFAVAAYMPYLAFERAVRLRKEANLAVLDASKNRSTETSSDSSSEIP